MSFDFYEDRDRERLSKYQYSLQDSSTAGDDEPSKPTKTEQVKSQTKSYAKQYVKSAVKDAAIANPEITIPVIIGIAAILLVFVMAIVIPIIFSFITGGNNASAATCTPSSISLTLPTIPASALSGGPWNAVAGEPAVTQPYYLEEFAISTLEDLAAKLGVPPAQAVTQEHVIALIGWFWKEGGDINNPDLFNPLNIRNNSGGFMSYSSYGAGVEGLAEAFVSPFQDRIAGILTQQGSTAEQVASVIANYENYTNNLSWSSPGDPSPGVPPTPAEVVTYDQNIYLPELDTSIEQARAKYDAEASLELGTSAYELQDPSKYSVSTSLLTYSQSTTTQSGPTTTTSTTTSTGDTSCVSSVSCNSSSPTTASTASNPDVSTLRQNVICIALNEYNEHWLAGPALSISDLDYFTTYTEGRHENWCADFVSWVYNQAGYPISGSSTDWDWPGVALIHSSAINGTIGFTWHAAGSGYTPQPGDLVPLSSPGNPDYHIEMVVSVNGPTITYIAGDTGNSSLFPNGTDGYGGTGAVNTPGYQSYSYVSETTSQADIDGYISPN